jgi:hypothetical protein
MKLYKTRVIGCVVAALVLGILAANAPAASAQATGAAPSVASASASAPSPAPTVTPTPRHHGNAVWYVLGAVATGALAVNIIGNEQRARQGGYPVSKARRAAFGFRIRF